MRNKFLQILLIFVFCLSAQLVWAAGFNATVEANHVVFGDSIKLKLLLTDAKPVEHIDISKLAKDFTIHNQQHFSSYRNANGVVQAETGWYVILMPKHEGDAIIPPITLETDKGRFSTQEIRIKVTAAKSGSKKVDSVGISLVSIVSKPKAYINEPVIYTLKIISHKNIANIVLDDIKSNDAIIEKIGEPKQYNQIHGGVNAHIIEIRYAVTALKAGKVTILPALMRGEVQVQAIRPQQSQRFGLFNDLLLDNLVELKPFSIQSDKITLDVIAPATKSANWLPLRSLDVSEHWDGLQDVKVGDTITRKIKMTAKGAFAKQLPSAESFMQANNLKIYANKPSFDDAYSEAENTIIGKREEEYSLVPQHAGELTLPAIKVQWWNVKTQKLETTTLPAKQIKVAAVATATTPNLTIDYSGGEPQQEIAAITNVNKTNNTLVYMLLAILLAVILSFSAIILYLLQRKPKVTDPKTSKTAITNPKPIEINTIIEMRDHILQYAQKHWHIATNVGLNRLGDALSNNNYSYDLAKYSELSAGINAALYAKTSKVDLQELMQLWSEFKSSVRKTKATLPGPLEHDYSSINPT